MSTIILFGIFLVVTIYSGFTFSRLVLNERRIFALVPLSILIGINAFNFLVNAVSYFVFIKNSVWVVLVCMFLFSVLISYIKRNELFASYEFLLTKKQYIILFTVALAISFLSGLVAVKSLALDDLFIGHMPLAVTITEGNFPVMDPSLPDRSLSYHYSADLLTANFNLIASIPIWLGYDLQTTIFSGALFLLLFLFLYEATKKYQPAIIGSVLFFYGNGLQWMYLFIDGISPIWRRFVLGEEVDAFWSFLTYTAFPKLNTSFIYSMNNHSTIIGVPVLILSLIYYFKALKAEDKHQSLIYIIFSGIFFGYLALSLETYFVITILAIISIVVISLISTKWKYLSQIFHDFQGRKFFITTIIFFTIALTIAFVQGGVISNIFNDTDTEKILFVDSLKELMILDVAPDPAKLNNPDTFIRIFDYNFFIQFGLPIILIIPAILYFFRRRNAEILFLSILSVGAFLVPFLFRLPSRNWEMSRFFLIAIPFFSLIIGVYLSDMYEMVKSKKNKYIVVLFIFFMGASGILSQLIFGVSNLDRFGKIGPLFMKPPVASDINSKAFKWIKDNTTLNDRFFPYDTEFIRHNGRFTPGVFEYFTFNYRTFEKENYNKIINECSLEAISLFKINYFYITPDFPIKNYKSCISRLETEVVYSNESGKDFVYIYKLK